MRVLRCSLKCRISKCDGLKCMGQGRELGRWLNEIGGCKLAG